MIGAVSHMGVVKSAGPQCAWMSIRFAWNGSEVISEGHREEDAYTYQVWSFRLYFLRKRG